MNRWIVLLSVCLHVISASFDYIYEEHSFMGKSVNLWAASNNEFIGSMCPLLLLNKSLDITDILVSLNKKLMLFSSTDPEDVLSVSIPLEEPQRPLLGGTLVLPCYFEVCKEFVLSLIFMQSLIQYVLH